MKQIQFTSGCPNQCHYCHEPKEMKYYEPDIPEHIKKFRKMCRKHNQMVLFGIDPEY